MLIAHQCEPLTHSWALALSIRPLPTVITVTQKYSQCAHVCRFISRGASSHAARQSAQKWLTVKHISWREPAQTNWQVACTDQPWREAGDHHKQLLFCEAWPCQSSACSCWLSAVLGLITGTTVVVIQFCFTTSANSASQP